MRSLLPKIDEICVYAALEKPDLMIFCETWLCEDVDNKIIRIPGYAEPYRHDRPMRRGGGVCVYPRSEMVCQTVSQLSCSPPFIECIWIALPTYRIILLAMYVPPNLHVAQLSQVNDYVTSQADVAMSVFQDYKIIVAGDLNNLPTSCLESTLCLTQCVHVPTRGNSVLDKILVDESLRDGFEEPIVGPNIGTADHLTVSMKPVNKIQSWVQWKKVYDYRSSNIQAFVKVLQSQQWQKLYYSEYSVDVKCEIFYEFVKKAQECIPFSYVKMTSKDKPWITPVLKQLINCRYEAYRRRNFEEYNHYKKKIKQEIQKSKSAWLKKLKKSPHGIWKAMPTKEKENLKKLADQYESPIHLANSLNSVFSSVFSSPEKIDTTCNVIETSSDEEWKIEISKETVSQMLRTLKIGKSPGHDALSPHILREAHDVLAGPLAHLFAVSVSTRKFPKDWKMALVAPIPKKKDPSLNDFRPISLLTIPSKLLETLILKSIKERLLAHYGDYQFGFRPGSSTLNANITIHDFVTRQLDKSSTRGVVMVAMDLSKAFDKLSHASLNRALSDAGLPKGFLLWLSDFLSDRKQRVVLQGALSTNVMDVTSGVPQGSVLAPYLFAFHMGTLSPVLPGTQLIKYADDVSILIPFTDNSDPSSLVQAEIHNMKKWCKSHGLLINDDKTKSLIFTKPGIKANEIRSLPNQSSCLKILGVTFQSSLKWDTHIEHVVKCASRRVHVLRMLRRISSATKNDLLQVYHNYILSIMEYNSPLFVGLSSRNEQKLECLARRCHRITCGIGCQCEAFGKIKKRREFQAMKVFEKMMSPQNICHSLLTHHLPRSGHFFIGHIKTHRRSKSFIPFCTTLWNANHKRKHSHQTPPRS